MTAVRFRVDGTPASKGSARAVTSKSTGRALLLASSNDGNARDQASWAKAVGWAAKVVCRAPAADPIAIAVRFILARPRSVKRARPSVKPDIDKLLRCTLDALTGIAWIDDAQVVEVRATKNYALAGERPGADIEIDSINH